MKWNENFPEFDAKLDAFSNLILPCLGVVFLLCKHAKIAFKTDENLSFRANVVLVSICNRIWTLLGATWVALGCSRLANWRQHEPTWANFRPSWHQFGSYLEPTWTNLAQLGLTLANLGPTWTQLGPTWTQLGANMRPTWSQLGMFLTFVLHVIGRASHLLT